MIIVPIDRDHVIVGTIAVDDETPLPRYLRQQPRKIESVAIAQLRRPLEHEDEGVCCFNVERKSEPRIWIRRTVDNHLVSKIARHPAIVVDVLRTASVAET